MTVWILIERWAGEVDIIGVYATKEAAELTLQKRDDPDCCYIEDYAVVQ